MASLEDKISDLKAIIADYEAAWRAAPDGDKIAYVNLITEKERQLNMYLEQQQQGKTGDQVQVLEAILDKKFVQFSISSRAKQVKVTNWLTGESQYVEFYSDTSFNEFFNATVDKLSLNYMKTVIYSLRAPDYRWRDRRAVSDDNFREVVSYAISGSKNDRPLLYAHPGDKSPEGSPLHLKEADVVSSLTSEVTDRSGQSDFKCRTMFRDNNICVFCGFEGQPLYAAHILEYAQYKDDQNMFKEYGIMGVNDTCNGITLCWNCHTAFDNYMVCVDPTSDMLIVAEALQHCEPIKWQKIHGEPAKWQKLQNGDNSLSSGSWPNYKLLSYRQGLMKKRAEERQKNREEYPYRCKQCHAGLKTLKGLMTRHAGSQKCAKRTGKMSSYTTPHKTMIDEEECIYENE